MQRARPFAVVTDEYGSFLGVVTLEDLIEDHEAISMMRIRRQEVYHPLTDRLEHRRPGRAEDVERRWILGCWPAQGLNTLSGLILSETRRSRDGDQFTLDVTDRLALRCSVWRIGGLRRPGSPFSVRRTKRMKNRLPPAAGACSHFFNGFTSITVSIPSATRNRTSKIGEGHSIDPLRVVLVGGTGVVA